MDFLALASECAAFVAPQTLVAIVKTESNYQPFRIGVNGGSRLERQPVSREEAVVTARWLLNKGYNIDLGLGQVNSANLNRVGLTVQDAFDPCKNIKASGTIFHKSYQAALRQYPEDQAFKAALSAYNTGNFRKGFANGYVQKVLGNRPDTAMAPIAVQPIPLTKGQKPMASDLVRPKNPEIQPASLAVESLKKVPTVFVYATESNGESPKAESTLGSSANVYGNDTSSVMVYR